MKQQEIQKYRLRLVFQEIDVGPGNFTIGRASACNLTVEDPLVSREHARILVRGRYDVDFRHTLSRIGCLPIEMCNF